MRRRTLWSARAQFLVVGYAASDEYIVLLLPLPHTEHPPWNTYMTCKQKIHVKCHCVRTGRHVRARTSLKGQQVLQFLLHLSQGRPKSHATYLYAWMLKLGCSTELLRDVAGAARVALR